MTAGFLISRVTTAAEPPTGLISLDTAKIVLGIDSSDTSQDEKLQAAIDSVSASICNYCDRQFVVQSYRDTWRNLCLGVDKPLRTWQYPIQADSQSGDLLLTITVDGTVLAVDQYDVDPADGSIYLLSGQWGSASTVLDYTAGYDPIPPDLQAAANELLTARWFGQGRDPGVRSETIPDLITQVYDSSASSNTSASSMPASVRDLLAPYILYSV